MWEKDSKCCGMQGMICKSGAGQDGWVGVRLDLRNEEVFPGGQREPRAARVEGRGQEGRGVGFLDWRTHPSVRVSETLLAGNSHFLWVKMKMCFPSLPKSVNY